jgi:hypothetical protein
MPRKTLLLLALALSAAPAAAPAQSPAWRLTPDGYGPVRIGMTRDQVSAALSIRLEGEAVEDANVCIEMGAAEGHPDLFFMFENGRLSRISLGERSRITTPRGIGIGATAAEVRRAYGRGLRAETHEYIGRPGEYLTFWTRVGAKGVRFETGADRRVRVIHAGNGSIQYIEGCA